MPRSKTPPRCDTLTAASFGALMFSRPLPIRRTGVLRKKPMILITRLNGPQFALNPDLIERVEATPDTVLTLVDGTKYLIADSVDDVIQKVREYRASVIALAQRIDIRTETSTSDGGSRPLQVVPDPEA
jgi:flagellar protein FlbD